MKRRFSALFSQRRERAQSLVELAISLTVMLLLLSGAVTFGMALFSFVAIRDAAQEGALYGSFNPHDGNFPADKTKVNVDAVRLRVRNASTSPVNLADTTLIPNSYITVEATTGNACEGTTTVSGVDTPNGIRVTVRYDYQIIMPYIGGIIGSQEIPLRATVTDTILEPNCDTFP
jgi:hypothetical protein